MDIALVVEKLVPNAQYTRCGTQDELESSWTDSRPCPTETELAGAETAALLDAADREDCPSLWEVVEALLALNADPSLDGTKSRITAAKAAGLAL